MGELIRDAVDAIRPLAVEKEINLHTELPSDPILFAVDGGRIRQAVLNLLGNGIRHTPDGGKVLVSLVETACLEPVETAVGLEISVADTGMGIAPDDLPFVFDRFYRTDASRNRETSGIVEGHNGRIVATSLGINHGSTFTVYLPMRNS